MKTPQLRRRPTRRERLAHRLDDLVGHACWILTVWFGRRLRTELVRTAKSTSRLLSRAG